jgi:Holliday junction resolvasome RuvABC endonuclease subunit
MSPLFVLGIDTGPKSHGWAVIRVEGESARYADSGNCPVELGTDLTKMSAWNGETLIAIEAPLHAYSAATASPIIATARAAGELGGAAKARGYRVEYVTAADWRAGLLGAANAHDRAIAAWVQEHIQGWPKKSNPHTRDAAALAVFTGRRWLRGQATEAL